MVEGRGFLGRWSARKRAARDAEAKVQHPAEAPAAEPAQQPATAAPVEPPQPPEIDPADLPPLDSIRTGADVQAFLQRGVPRALRQAALRRLWAADPAVRDFREVADYDWDFNAPGYGALLPGDDPAAMAGRVLEAIRQKAVVVRQMSAPPPTESAAVRQADAPPPSLSPSLSLAPTGSPDPPAALAAESGPNPDQPAEPAPGPVTTAPRRRRHGGAVPG